MSKLNFKIPDIAAGKVIPPKIENSILQEEKEKRIRNENFRKDIFLAILSAAVGAIFGNIDRICAFITKILSLITNQQ